MHTHCDCASPTPSSSSIPSTPKQKRRSTQRSFFALLEWTLPTLLLALMPKCPMCIAGYIALWTGLGISFTGAYYLRLALFTLCILSLCFLVAMRVRRHFLRPAHS